MVAIVVFRTGI